MLVLRANWKGYIVYSIDIAYASQKIITQYNDALICVRHYISFHLN